jgi:uncharacterized protein
MIPSVIDAHAHCGRRDIRPPQDFADYRALAAHTPIRGVVMFPPVLEIYDRYNPHFADNPAWQDRRRQANSYLLTLGSEDFQVFPYLFIWNDFAVAQLTGKHRGIKWHRHANEPCYRYADPRCAAALDEIRRRNLPVCLEEELSHTVYFIEQLAPGIVVIIPHLGLLNGGYRALRRLGVWDHPNVFTDTALAPPDAIADYVANHGSARIMFGSDFPFGDPGAELEKILRLRFSEAIQEAMLGANILRLMAGSNRPRE